MSKQQALDADPRAIQQVDFTGDLDREEVAFILEEAKENVFNCQSIADVLHNNLIWFNIMSI